MKKKSLVDFLIDGEPYQAPAGSNLIEAARANNVYIPTLCYLKDHECLGTCRVCTIKINGSEAAACTRSLEKGMNLEVDTDELKELRKSLVELMFVEGNHYCPSCEKSGDCVLQALGYEMDMRVPRFPYRFATYDVDYSAKHMVMEHNRCVHCKRCTDLYLDDDGKKIFSFAGRGAVTKVMIDLKSEANLSVEKVDEAVALCPVGAILKTGKGFDRPIGERTYDLRSIKEIELSKKASL